MQRRTQANTHALLNKHTGDQNICLKQEHITLSLFIFILLLILFFFTASHSALSVLVSVHTYSGALDHARDESPLLKHIQTSIKRHMACLPRD